MAAERYRDVSLGDEELDVEERGRVKSSGGDGDSDDDGHRHGRQGEADDHDDDDDDEGEVTDEKQFRYYKELPRAHTLTNATRKQIGRGPIAAWVPASLAIMVGSRRSFEADETMLASWQRHRPPVRDGLSHRICLLEHHPRAPCHKGRWQAGPFGHHRITSS